MHRDSTIRDWSSVQIHLQAVFSPHGSHNQMHRDSIIRDWLFVQIHLQTTFSLRGSHDRMNLTINKRSSVVGSNSLASGVFFRRSTCQIKRIGNQHERRNKQINIIGDRFSVQVHSQVVFPSYVSHVNHKLPN